MEKVQEQAIAKLESEKTLTSAGKLEKAIAAETANALMEFCSQSVEFASAVVLGESFEECCKAICKNVGSSISDLEIFRRAVKRYLPNADVKYRMEITVGVRSDKQQSSDNIIKLDFDLENFL